MSRKKTYNVEEQFQLLANQLARANTHFYFAKKLHENYQQLGCAKDFWDYTLTAHYSIALLDLSRIYDTHKGGINFFNSLKSIDKSALDQAKRTQLNDHIALCGPKTQNSMVQSLRTWRNNIIAHYNIEAAFDREGFDRNNPLEPEEIVHSLIERGFKILDWWGGCYGNVTSYQQFAAGKDSYKNVLECLRICGELNYEPI